MSLSFRYQSIDLQNKSMDWFLYDKGLRHKRLKKLFSSDFFSIFYLIPLHHSLLSFTKREAFHTFLSQFKKKPFYEGNIKVCIISFSFKLKPVLT